MGTNSVRQLLEDGSFLEISLTSIRPDKWRSHGIRYRFAWVQKGKCRVLFDNHHGKQDHMHIDGVEIPYEFVSVGELRRRFEEEVRKLGGEI